MTRMPQNLKPMMNTSSWMDSKKSAFRIMRIPSRDKLLMLSDKQLERTEEGNQERHGEIYAEAVEDGNDNEALARIAGDDR